MFKYFNKIKSLNNIFNEKDHPRDEDGKFTDNGKETKSSSPEEKRVFFSSERLNNLKKIREQEIKKYEKEVEEIEKKRDLKKIIPLKNDINKKTEELEKINKKIEEISNYDGIDKEEWEKKNKIENNPNSTPEEIKQARKEYTENVKRRKKLYRENAGFYTLLENSVKLASVIKNLKKELKEIESEKANDTYVKELDEYIEKYEQTEKKQQEYDKNFKGDKEGLKEYAESPLVATFHENPKLEFEPMPNDYVEGLNLIHQSPSYMGVRGSAYYLDYDDGKLYYVRDSDHWGNFSTSLNLSDLLEKYPEVKIKHKNDWTKYENMLRDIEKINGWDEDTLDSAYKHNFWKLKGADTIEEQRKRRVGRVLIKDFNK